MNAQRQPKKIDLGALDNADRKIARIKLKRILFGCAAVVLCCAGAFAAYRLIAGDVVASRFTVNKLNCPGCVTTVQEVTGKLPGVISADVSLAGQAVTVTHRINQTTPDALKTAIGGAGYEVQLDAVYKPGGQESDKGMLAVVNTRPVFREDLKSALETEAEGADPANIPAAFFSLVGKELLLREADMLTVAVQPFEVDQAAEALRQAKGVPKEVFEREAAARYGTLEKFNQSLARSIAIRKLFTEHVLKDVSDPKDRERKVIEWAGNVFKTADVRILDAELREKLRSVAGFDDWKAFWPRMIAQKSNLKTLFTQ
jgi:copper chaperone CopZ